MACWLFQPDHNGECLLCDEWADAHSREAIERGALLAMAKDWTDPVVARDAPERAADVVAQLIADITRLAEKMVVHGSHRPGKHE
jgi:hypothetical protein